MSSNPGAPVFQVSRDELEQARCDLAAVFRIAAHEKLNEGIDNHFSHALADGTFLVNRWGVHWSQMRRSDVLRVDQEGNVIDGDGIVERTAFYIHEAVHRQCPHAVAVLHTHMPYATAVACIEGGFIETLTQQSLFFYGKVSYESFGGLAIDRAEGDRMASNIGDHSVTFLHNHGVMVSGPTPGVALHDLYFLERACTLQVLAQSTGQPLVLVPENVAEATASQREDFDTDKKTYFNTMKKILDEKEPEYRN